MYAPFLIAAVLAVFSCQASAQLACDERPDFIEKLSSRFAETQAALGLAHNGGVVERFASDDGRTWTIIITLPDGTSCLIAAGTHWEVLAPQNKDPKS